MVSPRKGSFFSCLMLLVLTGVRCQIQPRSKNDIIVLGKSCVQEVEDYKQCLAQVREDIERRFNDTEKLDVRERMRRCLVDNGCNDPDNEPISEGLALRDHEKCLEVASSEARTIVHECVQRQVADFALVEDSPSLDDDVAEIAKSEFPTRGPWGPRIREKPGLLRLAVQALSYLKNSRICDVTANSTGLQLCIGRVFREASGGETAFDQVVEAELKFNFYCSGRDRCRQWMTESCQKYLDDGKSATCRCAKLDLFTKTSQLARTYASCVDKEAVRVIAPKVIDDLIRTYCAPSRDPCIENFPPRYQSSLFRH